MIETSAVIESSERSAGDQATATAPEPAAAAGVTRRTESTEAEAATVMVTPGHQSPDTYRVRMVSNKP
jgi:hypothetical protein